MDLNLATFSGGALKGSLLKFSDEEPKPPLLMHQVNRQRLTWRRDA